MNMAIIRMPIAITQALMAAIQMPIKIIQTVMENILMPMDNTPIQMGITLVQMECYSWDY